MAVRPCGADHQWRRVPPGQLSIGSGSWRAAWLGNWLGWSLATKVAFGRLRQVQKRLDKRPGVAKLLGRMSAKQAAIAIAIIAITSLIRQPR